jgi:RNA polymerase sigma factor (sigma-70 family)
MASPIGWAFHVGRNVGYSRVRRIAVGRRARARAAAAAGTAHEDPDTSERVAVQAALQQLPRTQREVLVLRDLLGLTTAETAEVLGVRADAVRARSSRARASLRSRLDDETSAGERDLEVSDGR